MTKTWCVGGRHKSNTNIFNEYEKINPRAKNLVEFVRGNCSIFGRNKPQIFTSECTSKSTSKPQVKG